jgi:hypothetical protein
MAKISAPQKKSSNRQNSNDAFGNFTPQVPAPADAQVMPVPSAAVRPVVNPPASGPLGDAAPLVR